MIHGRTLKILMKIMKFYYRKLNTPFSNQLKGKKSSYPPFKAQSGPFWISIKFQSSSSNKSGKLAEFPEVRCEKLAVALASGDLASGVIDRSFFKRSKGPVYRLDRFIILNRMSTDFYCLFLSIFF